MRAPLQRFVLTAALPLLPLLPVSAGGAELIRIGVLVEAGTEADRAPVEEALRDGSGLRVVGPIDRSAPRSAETLGALGESLDLGLLAVLARRDDRLVLRVFEVRRAAYFEGVLPSPFDAEAIREFVGARARTARHAVGETRENRSGGSSSLRLWAGVGVLVLAAGAFAAMLAFGGSEDAPDTVRVDVAR